MHEELAEGLSSGCSNYMNLFSKFSVTINLTEKGLKNYELVINYFF